MSKVSEFVNAAEKISRGSRMDIDEALDLHKKGYAITLKNGVVIATRKNMIIRIGIHVIGGNTKCSESIWNCV